MAETEVGEVSSLLRQCYAWLGEREGLTPQQIEFLQSVRGSEETVRRESGRETYLVAEDGPRIVGLVALAGNKITKLYVLPAKHGSGIGRALCQAAESEIRSGGGSTVELRSFPSAVSFYQVMGLRVVGWREPGGVLAGLRIALMEKRLEEPEASP